MKRVYIVGTADTKGQELLYIKALVEAAGAPALVVDVGHAGRRRLRSMCPGEP